MKRAIWIAAVLLVVLAACDSGGGFEDAVLGQWEGSSTVDENTYDTTWEFFDDGTMIMTIHTVLNTSRSFPATYAFEDDDTITIREDGAAADDEPGRRDIRMPDDDTLILTAPVSGAQAVLKRVEE